MSALRTLPPAMLPEDSMELLLTRLDKLPMLPTERRWLPIKLGEGDTEWPVPEFWCSCSCDMALVSADESLTPSKIGRTLGDAAGPNASVGGARRETSKRKVRDGSPSKGRRHCTTYHA